MPLFRPESNEPPGNQSSKTPSGKKVPMAMSLMVDSMVRMIQKADKTQNADKNGDSIEGLNEN